LSNINSEIAHIKKLFGGAKLERSAYSWGSKDFTKHKSRTESRLNQFKSEQVNKQRKREGK